MWNMPLQNLYSKACIYRVSITNLHIEGSKSSSKGYYLSLISIEPFLNTIKHLMIMSTHKQIKAYYSVLSDQRDLIVK